MKKLRLSKTPVPTRLKYWLLAVLASVTLVGFPYLAVQQNYRHGANDPQIQYAQDLSTALEQGATPEAFGGNSPIDPRKSLGLFLLITDEQKKVVANTMQLEGDAPVPPQSTFDAAKKGQQRFTWQPRGDVRVAAVMQHYGGDKPGFILVGRSIVEIEKREKELMVLAGGALAILIALSTLAVRIGMSPRSQRKNANVAAPGPLAFDAPETVVEEEVDATTPVKKAAKVSSKSKKTTLKKANKK